jgi:acyl carrier protein
MTSLTLTPRVSALKEEFRTSKIRACIAEHLDVDVESVSDDTHFRDDLGLDLIDILELIILLEDQFADGRVMDEDDEIEFVGDLIRCIENSNRARAS